MCNYGQQKGNSPAHAYLPVYINNVLFSVTKEGRIEVQQTPGESFYNYVLPCSVTVFKVLYDLISEGLGTVKYLTEIYTLHSKRAKKMQSPVMTREEEND